MYKISSSLCLRSHFTIGIMSPAGRPQISAIMTVMACTAHAVMSHFPHIFECQLQQTALWIQAQLLLLFFFFFFPISNIRGTNLENLIQIFVKRSWTWRRQQDSKAIMKSVEPAYCVNICYPSSCQLHKRQSAGWEIQISLFLSVQNSPLTLGSFLSSPERSTIKKMMGKDIFYEANSR